MVNFIVIVIILLIVGGAGAYIVKAKKRGVKCIGCPQGGCAGNCAGCCGGCGAFPREDASTKPTGQENSLPNQRD